MKKIIAGIGAALAAGAIALAPQAAASEQSYFQALSNGGFGEYSAADALAVGYMACNASGDPVDAVYYGTNGSIDYAEAQYIAAAALIHLC